MGLVGRREWQGLGVALPKPLLAELLFALRSSSSSEALCQWCRIWLAYCGGSNVLLAVVARDDREADGALVPVGTAGTVDEARKGTIFWGFMGEGLY